jgi:hypothetical protein
MIVYRCDNCGTVMDGCLAGGAFPVGQSGVYISFKIMPEVRGEGRKRTEKEKHLCDKCFTKAVRENFPERL